MSYQADREKTISVLSEAGWKWDAIISVLRAATVIQRVSELECSVEMSEREAARHAKRSERAEARIRKIAESMGSSARFDGDPRGYCVKVALPSGKYNTWGGAADGWGVAARGYPASFFERAAR